MKHLAILQILSTVILLLLCPRDSESLFFNKSSHLEIKPFNISKGFTLTFRTCSGGTLLQQNGTNTDYFELCVIPAFMNYTSQTFTPSSLALKWRTSSEENIVHVGSNLDQNKPYEVAFSPRTATKNTTLTVSIGNSENIVQVSKSILDIASNGSMVLGRGFVGCIDFGNTFDISNTLKGSVGNTSVMQDCPLDLRPICERANCLDGFKGYYCEINIDDCAPLPCHHASKCMDLIANYTCICGPSWYGRNCDQLKTSKPCDGIPCANGGICKHISDFNNYTCTCKTPFTGRNCSMVFDPCADTPCMHNGTCRNVENTTFNCDCSQGFGGRTCERNIDDCAKEHCGRGKCIDGIVGHTCNCTGTGFLGDSCQNDVNECNPSPCLNGTCTNYAGGYKCDCVRGYSGKNCETNIDDCQSRPCKNKGNCTDLLDDFSCLCPAGFSGKYCESPLQPCYVDKNCSACDDRPCQHGQCNCTCTAYTMFYNCTCDSGYSGVKCDDDINECNMNGTLCFNNSTCKNTPGGFYCQCPEDYTGKYCNESRSICHPSPCVYGNCSNVTSTNYTCSCFFGWKGRNCTEDVDECELSRDQCNRTVGSTCRNTPGSYKCECPPGYKGEYCNDDINECLPKNPCLHGGKCENLPGTFKCFCENGFSDINCSRNINDCAQGPQGGGDKMCKHGKCEDKVAGYKCVCDPGWNETFCDNDINECALGYCKNNATCNNTQGNYTCACRPGYTDFNCSTDIDECASGHECKHNSTCEDRVNDYFCNCSAGFEGGRCQTEIDWCSRAAGSNASAPCVYGVCRNHRLNYTCQCFNGFSGGKCETDVDECEKTPCRNGATCVQKSNDTAITTHFGLNATYPRNESDGYICICKPGFNGSDCKIDIDECQLLNPCNSTGTKNCSNLINDYNCTCKPGFQGRNCSEEIDECASEPCQNNGTCLDRVANFQCICDSNHTGMRCESRVDPCTAFAPCENNGVCAPTDDFNFTCSCAEGFAGKTCTDKTTLGFDGTASMTINVSEFPFNVSFSFRTIFPDGVIVSESTKWLIALSSGYLEVTWGTSVVFKLGSNGSFADARWHSVSILVSESHISAEVDAKTCTQQCSRQFQTGKRKRRAAGPSSATQLVVGTSSGVSNRSSFVGSIRDFSVNDTQYYPGISGVSAENVIPGFQRKNVCLSEPCLNGACNDLWTKYTCECYRNWTSINCSEIVHWGTFGAIRRLKNGYSSTGNLSFAKYSFFSSFTNLSFSVRTRSSSSVVVLLYLSDSVYLSVETRNGSLRLRSKGDVISPRQLVNDASEHFISINRSTIQIDGAAMDVSLPAFTFKDVFVGGVSGSQLRETLGFTTPFRGCIRDVRVNGEQLLFFNQTAGHLNSTQQNIAPGCSGEDVCGNYSGPPCNNGNCTDLWNDFECHCPWPYGGSKCELFGCEWTNPCPGNETCKNVGKAEYECLTEVTFNDSQSSAFFTNSTPFPSESLVAQFRTRQNASSLLFSGHNTTFFEIFIQEGRLLVSYNLDENITRTVNTGAFVSDGKWRELRIETKALRTSFLISVMEFTEAQPRYLSNYSLVRNISLLNPAFANLVSVAGVRLGRSSGNVTSSRNGSTSLRNVSLSSENVSFSSGNVNSSSGNVGSFPNRTREPLIGCLREIRIGDHLLSFTQNFTLKAQPGFSRAKSGFLRRYLINITSGCHGDPVCAGSRCGVGKCEDLWNDFSCACPDGSRGRSCQNGSCSPNPCLNGNCTINDGEVNCTCAPNYKGTRCDECVKNSCENDGTCKVSNETPSCACPDGSLGSCHNGSCVANSCKNGGKCTVSNGTFTCDCLAGWSGRLCEDVVTQEEKEEEEESNLPLIIGLSVAGGILLLVFVAIFFACTRNTSSTFGMYSPSGEEKGGTHVEMNPVLNVPPPEKLI